MELPRKENHPAISSDYELCLSHLKCLQQKMLKEPEVIHEYNQIIEEQVNKGIVKKVATEENKGNENERVHYLSHHDVTRRDRETTKLRVVYDGSAKPTGRCHTLNDCLETEEDGRGDVNLIASKTKVAPLKKQSIPRLELLGATILVRLTKTVQSALPRSLEAVYWVDSMTVLHWIRDNKPRRQYVLTNVTTDN